jgi:hypothetical protein
MPAFRILDSPSKGTVRLIAIGALGMSIYWYFVRPWHPIWGGVTGEISNPLTSDELPPSAPGLTSHAAHTPYSDFWIALLVCLIREPAGFIMERATPLGIRMPAKKGMASSENQVADRKSN